jgi:hypothetical protein
MTDEAHTL